MSEWTIAEWGGVILLCFFVIGCAISFGYMVESFKNNLESGLYNNNLPKSNEANIPPTPEMKREDYNPRLYNLAIERGWALPSVNDTHGAAAWNRYWADKEKAERGELLGRPVDSHRSSIEESMTDKEFINTFETYIDANGEERAVKMLCSIMAAVAVNVGGFAATDDKYGVKIDVIVPDKNNTA